MAKKKRLLTTSESAGSAPLSASTPARSVLPAEAGSFGVACVLVLAMLLAPPLGVPHEEMLQDTLKSIIVSFAALGAALLFFRQQRRAVTPLRWHAVLWLPLALMAYALGSMGWSHTYLAGVEAVRWFIFSVLAWLALNTFSRERLPALAAGIHAGAVLASLWTAAQFWFDLRLFPQGPNPASTFVNRNFFAEFVVCTLPFSALLLARTRQNAAIAWLSASTGFVLVAILMTGTRAALIAAGVLVLLVLPLIAWRCRAELACTQWGLGRTVLAAFVLLGTVAMLGSLPTGNQKLLEEGRGESALQRSLNRAGSIGPTDESLGLRMVMWRATMDAIRARPLTGLGAGAWESEIPLYQAAGAQLETDYYVHNEYLQLVAEYGLLGWAVLAALLAYLLRAAWQTWRANGEVARQEAPWRAVLLASLLALLIVSNVGFPWRMASTGALFALALGALAASDARLGLRGHTAATALPWRPVWTVPASGMSAVLLVLAGYITHQAAECERLIVRATKMALTVSASSDWNHPRWNPVKAQMLQMVREGIAINPHYRKITPMVADELARWGDWKNATWIWESVLPSRPHVVAILTNAARGHLASGQPDKAATYLERARTIRPDAAAVRSLEVVMLARAGSEAAALQLAHRALRDQVYDIDLLNTAFRLAWRAGDRALALQAMTIRQAEFPAQRLDGHVQLGRFHASAGEDAAAVASFRAAMDLTTGTAQRAAVLNLVPAPLRGAVETAARP